MRKTLAFFVAVLIGLFIFLSMLDHNSEYVSEKTLWEINQRFDKLMRDPDFVPGASFDGVAQEYENFITRFENSSLRPVASLYLAKAYTAKKDYLSARRQLERVVQEYKDSPKIASEAVYQTAQVYVLENDSINTLATYKQLLKEYPLTDYGMQAPLLVAKFYAEKNDLAKAKELFSDAVVYYQGLAKTYAGTQTELDALQLSATCLLSQSRWEEAVVVLGEELRKQSKQRHVNKNRISSIIKLINTVSITKLKNFSLPVSIYEEFINANKGHPLNGVLKGMIKNLKELQEKENIKVSK